MPPTTLTRRNSRGELRREIDMTLSGVDVLMTPTMAIEAPLIEDIDGDVPGPGVPVRAAMNRLVSPFNLSGHPALSIPMAADSGGAGIGMQIVAPSGADFSLLTIAAHVETALSER